MATPEQREQLEKFGNLVKNLGETAGEKKMTEDVDKLWTSDYRFEWAMRACGFIRDVQHPNGPITAFRADPRDIRIALTFWRLAQFKELRDVQTRHRMRMKRNKLCPTDDEYATCKNASPLVTKEGAGNEIEEKEEEKLGSLQVTPQATPQ